MKQHQQQKDIRNLSESSNVVKQVIEQKHSFNFNQAETLSKENN